MQLVVLLDLSMVVKARSLDDKCLSKAMQNTWANGSGQSGYL